MPFILMEFKPRSVPEHALQNPWRSSPRLNGSICSLVASVGAPFPAAEGTQAVPFGDAVVQTQECSHVSEQLLAVVEGTLPRQAD